MIKENKADALKIVIVDTVQTLKRLKYLERLEYLLSTNHFFSHEKFYCVLLKVFLKCSEVPKLSSIIKYYDKILSQFYFFVMMPLSLILKMVLDDYGIFDWFFPAILWQDGKIHLGLVHF